MRSIARSKSEAPSVVAASLITIAGHFDPGASTIVVFSAPRHQKTMAPALSVTGGQVVTYVPFITDKKGRTTYPRVSVTVEQKSSAHITRYKALKALQITPGSATGLPPGTVTEQMLANADARISTAISDLDVIQVLSALGPSTFPLYFDLQPLVNSLFTMQSQVEQLKGYVQSIQSGATQTFGQIGKSRVVFNSNLLALSDEILLQLQTGGLTSSSPTAAAIPTVRTVDEGGAAGLVARAKASRSVTAASVSGSGHPDSALGTLVSIVGALVAGGGALGVVAGAAGAGYVTAVGLGILLGGAGMDTTVAANAAKALSADINYLISPSNQAQQATSQTQDPTPSQLANETSGSYGDFNSGGGDLLKNNTQSAQQVADQYYQKLTDALDNLDPIRNELKNAGGNGNGSSTGSPSAVFLSPPQSPALGVEQIASLSPNEVDYLIRNTGSGQLSYTVSSDLPIVQFSTISGKVAAGSTQPLRIVANAAGWPARVYTVHVTISGAPGTARSPITLTLSVTVGGGSSGSGGTPTPPTYTGTSTGFCYDGTCY